MKTFAISTASRADLRLLTELGEKLHRQSRTLNAPARELLISSLLKIRDREGRLVPLVPNRAQAEFSRRCGRRNLVLKARQLGITTYVAARFFVATITRPGTLSVQVAHNQESAEEIFRIVHRFLENLPEALRDGALATSRANVRQIVFPRLDSEYRVETAADPNAGRGLTIHNLHGSEVARWPRDAAGTLASLMAAVAPCGEVILESTPAGAGGCFYDEWQHADERGWTRHFFPWWYEASYRADTEAAELDADEHELVTREKLSLEQIAWRRRMRATFRGLAPQEFAEDPLSCFLASGECVFDVGTIQKRLAELIEPAESRDNGRLLLWLPPQTGREYVIGADPAGGGSLGDYACAQVLEAGTGLQCAELHGHFAPAEFASRLAALAREFNGALVAVERNNHGHGVLAYLVAAEKYDRLYERTGQLGWPTTAATRPQIVEGLAALLSSAPHLFASAALLEECRAFVRHADGTSAAAAGAHDDRVMAMAIAHAVRRELAGDGAPPGPSFDALPAWAG